MNKEWSDQNKSIQSLLKKATFDEGIAILLDLREKLMDEILSWRAALDSEDYASQPFLNASGYHSKTIAYSLWHIFRIEDIVVHSLILQDTEVLFSGDFVVKTHSPIITTGNELIGKEIASFSRQLDLDGLYNYIKAVKNSTDAWLKDISYIDLKTRFTEEDRARIIQLNVVSAEESAAWLIDYWCSKDIKGLIQMPLSRHWIMHIEAALRIIHKIKRNPQKHILC